MKTELFAPVLAWLKAGAPHTKDRNIFFNMNHFALKGTPNPDPDTNHCGTACCIAGAVNQFNKLGVTIEDSIEACYAIGHQIGMTADQIENLFFGEVAGYRDYYLEDIPPALAADMLEQFIATGYAPWPESLPE